MPAQVAESLEAKHRNQSIGQGAPARRGPTNQVRALILAPLAAIGLLIFYSVEIEPAWIEVTHYRLPAPFSPPVKIAQLSDLHTKELGRPERRVLALLGEEKPDLIVLTGDVTNNDAAIEDSRPLLERLHAPLGVWMVRGNWEVWRLMDDTGAFVRSIGIHFLMNENRQVRDGLWLVGIDDPRAGNPDPQKALAGVPPGAYSVTIVHAPVIIDELVRRTNLVLAGHTHGGQIRFPFMDPWWLPKASGDFVAGWYHRGDTPMYVSRGIGMSVLPARFLCRPELTIITLGE